MGQFPMSHWEFPMAHWNSQWLIGIPNGPLGFPMAHWISQWLIGIPNGSLEFPMAHWNSQWLIGIPNGSLEFPMAHWDSQWLIGIPNGSLGFSMMQVTKYCYTQCFGAPNEKSCDFFPGGELFSERSYFSRSHLDFSPAGWFFILPNHFPFNFVQNVSCEVFPELRHWESQ